MQETSFLESTRIFGKISQSMKHDGSPDCLRLRRSNTPYTKVDPLSKIPGDAYDVRK